MSNRILIALFVFLSGCSTGNHVISPENVREKKIFDLMNKTLETDSRVAASRVRKFIANQTIKTYNRHFSTQVEFHSADGRTFLWFPGNRRIVRGRWKVEKQTTASFGSSKKQAIAFLCYKYGPNTYNPVTKQKGGKWKCIAPNLVFKTKSEKRTGDIFRLSGRESVPFVLQRKKYTFRGIKQAMKGK